MMHVQIFLYFFRHLEVCRFGAARFQAPLVTAHTFDKSVLMRGLVYVVLFATQVCCRATLKGQLAAVGPLHECQREEAEVKDVSESRLLQTTLRNNLLKRAVTTPRRGRERVPVQMRY